MTTPEPDAVIIPLRILTPLPTIESPRDKLVIDTVVAVKSGVKIWLAVTNPTTFAVPRTSRISVGIVVPIPTNPVELTTRLSSSTCIPLRKLNCFLIFAILLVFSYLFVEFIF